MDYAHLTDELRRALVSALTGPAALQDGDLDALCVARTALYESIDQTLALLTAPQPGGHDLLGALTRQERHTAGVLRAATRRAARPPGLPAAGNPSSTSRIVVDVSAAAHTMTRVRDLLAEHLRSGSGLTATGRNVAGGSDGRAVLADTVTYLAAAIDLDTRITALAAASVEPDTQRILDDARQVSESASGEHARGLAQALRAEPSDEIIPASEVSADLRPVGSLDAVDVTGPQQLAAATEQLTHWIREHPGRLSVADHTRIAALATDLLLLIHHVEPHMPGHRPDPVVDATSAPAIGAWNHAAAELTQLRPPDPRPYLMPLLANIAAYTGHVLGSADPTRTAAGAASSRGHDWRVATVRITAVIAELARVLPADLDAQEGPADTVSGVQVRTDQTPPAQQWRPALPADLAPARNALFTAGVATTVLHSAQCGAAQRSRTLPALDTPRGTVHPLRPGSDRRRRGRPSRPGRSGPTMPGPSG